MSSSDERLARIEEKLDSISGSMMDLKKWVSEHEPRIRELEGYANRTKGGWAAILGISAISGILGGVVGKLFGK